MDLLDSESGISLGSGQKKIYARNYAAPPTEISKSSNVKNSFIAEGCTIRGTVENSIIFTGCEIGKGAHVVDSVVMPNSHIMANSDVLYSIIGENVNVGKNCVVGGTPGDYDKKEWGISVIGKDNIIKDGTVIKPKEII